MKKTIALLIVLTTTTLCVAHADTDRALEKRIAKLEQEVAELKQAMQPAMNQANLEKVKEEQRQKARMRMRKDSEKYSRDERREIESLYQVANKNWRTDEGKESLEKLIKKYDKANRTGCALLYLGQMSKGVEREKYLEQAIEDFSDCFYGNGVQVGAYARFYLAHHHKDSGNNSKAEKLFDEIRDDYPDAIDHKGRPLSSLINQN